MQPLAPFARELRRTLLLARRGVRRRLWALPPLPPTLERALGSGLPYLGTLVGLVLLLAAAASVVLDAGNDVTLFGLGAGAWLLSLAFGVWFNGRPRAASP